MFWVFHKAHLHCLGTKERMLGVLRACWCVRSIILCLLFNLCRFRLCAAKRSFAPLNTDVKMSPLNEAGRVWSVIYLFGKLAHYQAAAHLHSPQLPDLLIQIFKNIFFLDSDKQYESNRAIMRKYIVEWKSWFYIFMISIELLTISELSLCWSGIFQVRLSYVVNKTWPQILIK